MLALLHPFFDYLSIEAPVSSYSKCWDFALLNKLVEGPERDPQHPGYFVGCQYLLIHYRQGNHRLAQKDIDGRQTPLGRPQRFPPEDGATSPSRPPPRLYEARARSIRTSARFPGQVLIVDAADARFGCRLIH
jgi:hypothetical protein